MYRKSNLRNANSSTNFNFIEYVRSRALPQFPLFFVEIRKIENLANP